MGGEQPQGEPEQYQPAVRRRPGAALGGDCEGSQTRRARPRSVIAPGRGRSSGGVRRAVLLPGWRQLCPDLRWSCDAEHATWDATVIATGARPGVDAVGEDPLGLPAG